MADTIVSMQNTRRAFAEFFPQPHWHVFCMSLQCRKRVFFSAAVARLPAEAEVAELENYRKKRNFQHTPEPTGERRTPAAEDGGLFVVHKHAARRLHFDLRLEHNGVLESWAVPKGPGREPGDKRLAVRVEDHPLEYSDFEGVIPRGEYGAGTVMLWDRGRWVARRRDSDRIDFVLEGQKLHGAWSLVRMGGRAARDGDNWLLIKRSDPGAKRNAAQTKAARREASLPENVSVATGRTMEQIRVDRSRTWSAHGKARSDATATGCSATAGGASKAAAARPAPAARHADRRRARWRGLGARNKVRRLPHTGPRRTGQGAADQP